MTPGQQICTVYCIMLLLSCSTPARIAGKYAERGSVDCFQLFDNGTFYYEYGVMHLYRYANGSWKKTGKNSILLNSDVQCDTLPISLKEVKRSNEDSYTVLTIHFMPVGKVTSADYACKVFINDTLYLPGKEGFLWSSGMDIQKANGTVNVNDWWAQYCSCDSLSTVKVNTAIKNIRFQIARRERVPSSDYISTELYTEKRFFPDNSAAIIGIDITLTDALFFYKVIRNQEICVQKNALKVLYQGKHGSRWRSIRRVADSAIIFSGFSREF